MKYHLAFAPWITLCRGWLFVSLLGLCLLIPTRARGGSAPTIPDNSGSFTYSIPFAVPSGPAGSQPDIALHYSSAAGNGTVGAGFSLPYSSIALDLGWGVPGHWLGGLDLCDPDTSEGRLFLDGMELIPSRQDPRAPGICTLRTRPDTFALVVPILDPSGDCADDELVPDEEPVGFAVVRPDGDVWWYGDAHRCDEIGRVRTRSREGEHTSGWLLRHVEDRDGNLVSYWPERVPEDADAATLLGSSPFGGEEDLRGCDGCLRAVTWAQRLAREDDFAFDPMPIVDSGVTVGWQAQSSHAYGSVQRSVTGRFGQFLSDPASFFPAPANHYYAAVVDWEDRPDARVSYLTGQGARNSRRIKQVAIAADARVTRQPDGRVDVDSSSSSWIRSYRLDYDQGSTGRSRLRRVWPISGDYDPSGSYPSIASRDELDWDPGSYGDDIDNPWELVYSGSDWLSTDSPDLDLALEMPVLQDSTGDSTVPWLGANWQEGGFPTVVLQDMNGDSLPDLVQHDPDLPAYPVYVDELLSRVSPFGDWLPNPEWQGHEAVSQASPSFWVRYNDGQQFLRIEEGPVDPFAVQEVADYLPSIDCDGDGVPDSQTECAEIARLAFSEALEILDAEVDEEPVFDCIPEVPPEEPAWETPTECWNHFVGELGPDVDDVVNAGSACEVYWTGGPTMLATLGVPIDLVGITPAMASWCEHRSCAPYCESSSNANSGLYGDAHANLLGGSIELGSAGLELEDVLALETTKEALTHNGVSGGELVLWRKYGVTRGTSGTALGNAAQLADFFQAPFAIDPVLGALESSTRVRWVDGYARPSFQTRLYSEDVEILRGTGVTTPLDFSDDAPEAVVTLAGHSSVLEGMIHDTIDLNGDGVLDRVLGGGAVLWSDVPGGEGEAVFNPLEDAPKDLVVSNQHLPWFVAFGDPETREFGPIQAWHMPLGDPLLGDDPSFSTAFADGVPDDPRMWQEHHFNLLGVWESTNTHARAPVSSGVSGSVLGASGPSLGASASFGPVSVSMGLTAGGGSIGVGIGPVSVSTSGLSIGPVNIGFTNGVNVDPWGFVFAFVQMALEDFDIPYAAGLNMGPDGLSWSIPGVGSECVLGCGKGQARWQRQGLYDLNGDGLLDYVIADNPNWQLGPGASAHDWVVVFNEGDGWASEAVEWTGVHTDYLNASFTDLYRPNLGNPANEAPFYRLGHQMAGLQDMNGDRLPDFVFNSWENGGDCLAPPARAVADPGGGGEPLIAWTLLQGDDLCVQLNNGHGFEEPRTWFPNGVPAEIFTPETGQAGMGAVPSLATTRTYLEHSETYNDGFSTGIAGVQDWNGDGLPDFYRMLPAETGIIEDRTLVIYLNSGTGFAVSPIGEATPIGRATPSLAPLGGSQTYPPGPPQVGFDLAHLDLSITRKFVRPGGPVVQTRVVDIDGDGRLDIAQSVEADVGFEPAVQVFPLQDTVPDVLTSVWEPTGAHRAVTYLPAREFLDLPDSPAADLPGAQRHGDLIDDAFPAPSQVVSTITVRDGLGVRGAPPVTTQFSYGEPGFVTADPSLSEGTGVLHPSWRGRSLGWGQVLASDGRQQVLNEYGLEPSTAGLALRSAVTDTGGELWSETVSEWVSYPFATNYEADSRPLAWFGMRNWHHAPVRVSRRSWEPSQSGVALTSSTSTEYDARNGLPVCVFEEIDGDLWADSVSWTTYSGQQIDDGRLDVARADGVAMLPLGSVGGAVQGQCAGLEEPDRPGTMALPFSALEVRSAFYELYPTGRARQRVSTDETGLAPDRRVGFDYYPNGQPFQKLDDLAIPSSTLYDPVVGVYPIEEHAPATYGPSGPVAHIARMSACGLVGQQQGCSPAAHGAASWSESRSGLETWSAFDGLGRLVAQEDSLSLLGPGASTWTYERSERRVPVWALPLGVLGNRPATVTTIAPFDAVGGPGRSTSSITFLDGLGRTVLTASDWEDESATVGQRLDRWIRRDTFGAPEEVLLPCFAQGGPLTSQTDFDLIAPFDDDLGLCTEAAAKSVTAYEPDSGRLSWTDRPDGSRVDLAYSIDAAMNGASVTTSLTEDGGLLSRTAVLTTPRMTRTRRYGAVSWGHPDATDLPGVPVQVRGLAHQAGDIDLGSWVDTWELRDDLGRRIEVTRTGVPSGEETRWELNGFDGIERYSDPDQGTWEFDYDNRGFLQRRELQHAWLATPVVASEFDRDAQGRVTEERHFENAAFAGPPDETWNWTYDLDLGGQGPSMGIAGEVDGGHVGKPSSVERLVPDLCGAGPGVDTVFEWRYDRRGRTTEVSQSQLPCDWQGDALAAAPTLVSQSRYSNSGERIWARTPLDGEEILTELDAVGRPVAVWSDTAQRLYVGDVDYELFGRPASIVFGNGVVQEFTYETGQESAQALVHSTVERLADGAIYFDRDYTWDAAGNLRRYVDLDTSPWGGAYGADLACGYDGLGQLLDCRGQTGLGSGSPSVGWYQYGYDDLGNLAFEDVDMGSNVRFATQWSRGNGGLVSSSGAGAPLNGPVARVVEPRPGKSLPSMSFFYDDRGHIISQRYHDEGAVTAPLGGAVAAEAGLEVPGGSLFPHVAERSFGWTTQGRLKAVSVNDGRGPHETARYWYGPGGGRIGQRLTPDSGSFAWVEQRRSGGIDLVERDGETPRLTKHVFLGARRVAQVDGEVLVGAIPSDPADVGTDQVLVAEEVRFFGGDHLGSASVVTDESGALLRGVRYEPFGRVAEEWGPDQLQADFEPGAVRDLFNGKPRDRDAYGLGGTEFALEGYDYGARIYLPEIGRWASADTITPDSVWEANPFAYVRNNPLRYVDPTGHAAHIAAGAVIGGLIGAGVEGWAQVVTGDFDAGRLLKRGAQGAVVGGFAAATGGTSLLAQSTAVGTLSVVTENVIHRSETGENLSPGQAALVFTLGAAGNASARIASEVAGGINQVAADAAEGFAEQMAYGRGLAGLASAQDVGEAAAVQVAALTTAESRLAWTAWSNYEKVVYKGQEYAQIGGRLYSQHAVERMQPSHLRASRFQGNVGTTGGHPQILQASSRDYGRGVAPAYVEAAIETSVGVPQANGNISHMSGSLQVILSPDDTVVTVITHPGRP